MSTTSIVISAGTYGVTDNSIVISTGKYPDPQLTSILINSDKYAGANATTSATLYTDKWGQYSYTSAVMSNFVWNGIMPEGWESMGMVDEIVGYTGHWVAFNGPGVYDRYLQQEGWDSNADSGWARWTTFPFRFIHFCGLGIAAPSMEPNEWAMVTGEAMHVEHTAVNMPVARPGGITDDNDGFGVVSVRCSAVAFQPKGFNASLVSSDLLVEHVI